MNLCEDAKGLCIDSTAYPHYYSPRDCTAWSPENCRIFLRVHMQSFLAPDAWDRGYERGLQEGISGTVIAFAAIAILAWAVRKVWGYHP